MAKKRKHADTVFRTSTKSGNTQRSDVPLRRLLLPGLSAALLGVGATFFACTTDQSALSQFDPPPELRSDGKWAAFKALWREVGAVKPARPDITPPEGRHFATLNVVPDGDKWRMGWSHSYLPNYDKRAYYLSLDEAQARRFLVSLRNIFDLPDSGSDSDDYIDSLSGSLAKKNVSVEAMMLVRLLQLRIQQMSMSRYWAGVSDIVQRCWPSMTRMAPPMGLRSCRNQEPPYHFADVPPSHYMVGAIDRIEARIDALMDLRAKGVVSESVFASALAVVQNDAKLVLHLDTLKDAPLRVEKVDFVESRGQTHGENVDLRDYQIWERAWEHACEHAQERAAAAYDHRVSRLDEKRDVSKQRLAELREAYPRLEELLAELER